MAFKNITDRPPHKHPRVEMGWIRVELPEVAAETDKAILFDFKDPKLKNHGLIWIPKTCCNIRYGFTKEGDEPSVLDIKEWFYNREIEK